MSGFDLSSIPSREDLAEIPDHLLKTIQKHTTARQAPHLELEDVPFRSDVHELLYMNESSYADLWDGRTAKGDASADSYRLLRLVRRLLTFTQKKAKTHPPKMTPSDYKAHLKEYYSHIGNSKHKDPWFDKEVAKLYADKAPRIAADGWVDDEPPTYITFADVEAKPVSWLWYPHVPAGKLTILDGEPETGKSTLSCDIAARISTGVPMPDGQPGKPGTVILMNAEDGCEDTTKNRLVAAGADVNHVIPFLTITDRLTGKKRQVILPEDVEEVRKLVIHTKARLVVIDSLWAFVGSKHKAISDQHMREALQPLVALADETGVAIIIVRHFNKNSKETNPALRGAGTIGITGLARNVLATFRDHNVKGRFYLARIKANLAQASKPLCFELRSTSVHTGMGVASVARVEWLGTVDVDPYDLMARDGTLSFRQKQVFKVLDETTPMSAQDIADKLDISKSHATNLLSELHKKGFAENKEAGRFVKYTSERFKIEDFETVVNDDCDFCDSDDHNNHRNHNNHKTNNNHKVGIDTPSVDTISDEPLEPGIIKCSWGHTLDPNYEADDPSTFGEPTTTPKDDPDFSWSYEDCKQKKIAKMFEDEGFPA